MTRACATCGEAVTGAFDDEHDASTGELHRCKPLSVCRTTGCDQCRGPGPTVTVGEPYDWETATAHLCAACLSEASIALAKATA